MAPRINPDDRERCYDCLSFRQQVDRFIGSAETTNKSVLSMVEKVEKSLEKVHDRYNEVDSSVSMMTVKVDGIIDDIQEIKRKTGKGYPALTTDIIAQMRKQEDELTDRIETKLKIENIEKSGVFKAPTLLSKPVKSWYEYIPFIVSALVLISILSAFGYWFFRGPGDMDPETVKMLKQLVKEKRLDNENKK